MIVTCERCATQFQLEDSRVPATGVRVRCSRCKHAFEVAAPGAGPEEALYRATESAVEDAVHGPGTTQDLSIDAEIASSADTEPDLRDVPGAALPLEDEDDEESDWEFNHDLPDGGLGEEAASGEAVAAARTLVDDLLAQPPPVDSNESDDVAPGTQADPSRADPEAGFEDVEEPGIALEPAGDRSPLEALDDLEAGRLDEVAPPEPELAVPAESPPRDELGSPDEWDFFASEVQGPAGERRGALASPASSLGGAGRNEALAEEVLDDEHAPTGRSWLGHVATAAGWAVTIAALCVALYASLVPRTPTSGAATTQTLPGFRVSDVASRWIPNAVAGPLFVVSGRFEPDGSGSTGERLGVALLDREGRALLGEPTPIGPPIDPIGLRQADPARLLAQQQRDAARLAGSPGPIGGARFEAVVAFLPPEAVSFRFLTLDDGAQDGPEMALPGAGAPDEAAAPLPASGGGGLEELQAR